MTARWANTWRSRSTRRSPNVANLHHSKAKYPKHAPAPVVSRDGKAHFGPFGCRPCKTNPIPKMGRVHRLLDASQRLHGMAWRCAQGLINLKSKEAVERVGAPQLRRQIRHPSLHHSPCGRARLLRLHTFRDAASSGVRISRDRTLKPKGTIGEASGTSNASKLGTTTFAASCHLTPPLSTSISAGFEGSRAPITASAESNCRRSRPMPRLN